MPLSDPERQQNGFGSNLRQDSGKHRRNPENRKNGNEHIAIRRIVLIFAKERPCVMSSAAKHPRFFASLRMTKQ